MMTYDMTPTKKQMDEFSTNHIACKSNYKFTCFCCGEVVNRGDIITRCEESSGQRLRVISRKGGTWYTPYTGDRWVHLHCNPRCWTHWQAYTYQV